MVLINKNQKVYIVLFLSYSMVKLIEKLKDIKIGDLRKVYVCSPVKGDQNDPMIIRENIHRATLYARDVYCYGFLPICPHIYLESATGLNEADRPEDREDAIRLGLELLTLCDQVWVYGRRCGQESKEMKNEIKEGLKRHMPILYRDIYSPKP